MATKAQVAAFIAVVAPIAVAQAKKHGNKIYPSVCIAQACCESAYGTSKKMIKANAVFGIKVGSSKYHFGTAWKDKAYSTATSECYDGKNYTKITDMFRAYDSISDAVGDYFDLLCSASRYKYALNQASPLACITGIQKGPYATSPTYVSTIMSIIKSQNLTQYDQTSSTSTATAPTYTVGKNYTLQANMFVRVAAAGGKKAYSLLTANAKANAINSEGNGVLKKGTKVTVQEAKKSNSATWIRIPSGWICAIAVDGKIYVK